MNREFFYLHKNSYHSIFNAYDKLSLFQTLFWWVYQPKSYEFATQKSLIDKTRVLRCFEPNRLRYVDSGLIYH